MSFPRTLMWPANCQKDQQPLRDSLNQTNNALGKNQEQIDTLIQTITSGTVNSDMMAILNKRAAELRGQREVLRQELHRFNKSLIPTGDSFDIDRFQKTLSDFEGVLSEAAPEKIQKFLRLTIKNIKWSKDGVCEVDFYIPLLENKKPANMGDVDWFDVNVQSGGLGHRSSNQMIIEVCRRLTGGILPDLTRVFWISLPR